MKKITKLLLPLLILSSLSANDKLYSFIGMQSSLTSFDTESVNTFGLKYGKQTKNIRTSISYNYGKKSHNKYQNLLLQIDTGIFKKSFKDISLKPYIGGTFGVMQEDTNIRDRGYVFGPNIGFTYIVNDALDFNVGYKYLRTSKLMNIDKINDLTLSMHYFY